MNFDTQVKLAVYRHFAESGQRPSAIEPDEIRAIFSGLGLQDDFWDPTTDSFG